MPSTAERIDFFPPAPQGTGKAMSLALLAHLLLAGALTWGVSWKRDTITTAQAELWSSLPELAAPKPVEVAPPPAPKLEVPPAPPVMKAPDIAVEQEMPKPHLKVQPKIEPKPETKPTPKPDGKPEPKVDKFLEAKKLAIQKEAERLKNIERMAGLAGASGARDAQGSAVQSSGMANGWENRIKARVNPQITFSGDRSGLKPLDLSISLLPDGTISGRPRLLASSGNPQWDEAVIRAFEKAESLPRDSNGKLPTTPFILVWKPSE